MKATIETLECGHAIEANKGDGGTGYGEDSQGNRHCYACCAERDRTEMRDKGRTVLYLTTGVFGDCEVGNWPGSLKFKGRFRKGNHNIARTRYDVWFVFEGAIWHGVQYGEWTQICHCRKTKQAAWL